MEKQIQMDWERCVEFHGHICPGLAIGFQAAQIALKVLPALEGEPVQSQKRDSQHRTK
ncbi:FmdE family protein [Desulfosporosinus nitroreducens]|uniref:FmdE family protein n=1 Tax=Desulfosporosinus nitroreducens TaxID=2018668 RepID=UPI00265CE38B|nr:FmdE family protein [Desulfosporosinus nitroreducens]